MRISLNAAPIVRIDNTCGYGKSFIKIQESFRKFEYNGKKINIEYNSPRSRIQMYYGPHPVHNAHYDHQFKIHMSQIEASGLEKHKIDQYNNVNEFWTANYWGASAAINSGVDKNKVFVYEHGIESKEVLPMLRGKKNKIRFLHIDSGSPRKRSDLVEQAFNELYKNNKDIELTLKYSHSPHGNESWLNKEVLEKRGNWLRPGTRHINETLSIEEMKSLINFHDVLVYPSEGEGFGLIPLECLVTGMPTISTHEWCSYSKYLHEGKIISEIKPSKINWGYHKKGNGTIATIDSVIDRMQYFIDNIDTLSNKFYNQVDEIKDEYTWENKTNKFLNSFIDRVGVDMFKKCYR
jgi:glycosyltransferase involved in cell wall biosynthesis